MTPLRPHATISRPGAIGGSVASCGGAVLPGSAAPTGCRRLIDRLALRQLLISNRLYRPVRSPKDVGYNELSVSNSGAVIIARRYQATRDS